jgi:hypothetical protein
MNLLLLGGGMSARGSYVLVKGGSQDNWEGNHTYRRGPPLCNITYSIFRLLSILFDLWQANLFKVAKH